jgi:hypothetical protein
MDPDPSIFIIDLQDANKKLIKKKFPEQDPDPDLYLWLMDPDPDPGGPKTCESGFGSGSATLLIT